MNKEWSQTESSQVHYKVLIVSHFWYQDYAYFRKQTEMFSTNPPIKKNNSVRWKLTDSIKNHTSEPSDLVLIFTNFFSSVYVFVGC